MDSKRYLGVKRISEVTDQIFHKLSNPFPRSDVYINVCVIWSNHPQTPGFPNKEICFPPLLLQNKL